MKFVIASGAAGAILNHARDEHPREACGLLLGLPGRVERAEPAANVAAHPERGFEIDPAALLRWHREARGLGLQVVGHYHSHPNGLARPSPTDAARAVEDGQLWVIAVPPVVIPANAGTHLPNVAPEMGPGIRRDDDRWALTAWHRTADGFAAVDLA